MRSSFRTLLLLLLISSWVADPSRQVLAHHAVLRFNLEEMTATADRIFLGRCLAVEETDEWIAQGETAVTLYTFEVERVLKGRVPRTIVFRQLGHPPRRALGKGGEMTMHGRTVTPKSFLHSMTEYHVGDRLILFLIPNYLEGRVTYPVGLYQGAFYISDMPSGQKLVRNTINNLGLFTAPYNGTSMKRDRARVVFPERDNPLQALQGASGLGIDARALVRRRGALPLDPFLELVSKIVATHGDQPGIVVGRSKGAIRQ